MRLQLMNNRQYFITLPNQLVRAKGWRKGDIIVCELDNLGNIVLKKVEA